MRKIAVVLIKEANKDGARIFKACEALEISVSTFERWRKGKYTDNRKGADKVVTRRLTEKEKQKIIDVSCSQRYKDDNPYTIHASLLDSGIYVASISSFYRVLREKNLVHHRGNTHPGTSHNKPPERVATGPNQVWTWDITWIPSYVRGIFYYSYTIIDIWDRSIVKWAIHDRESDVLAQELFQAAFEENGHPDVFVHSDNGNPMKGVSLLALFYKLEICNSYSRPRVSDDNPFIESWFKTMKYDVSYPGKFDTISSAREWFAGFVHNYNTAHSHSGLNYMTPMQVRNGEYLSIVKKRNKTMLEAKKLNPIRWGKKVKQLPEEHVVYLNPSADTRIKLKAEKERKKAS